MAEQAQLGVQRTLDSIQVGTRHRTDLGDIPALAESIQRDGLLQPITVTPDGVLVCGRRRLEALRLLGHRTTTVWVRSGLTDRLSQLLAEQSDNALHKPLSLIEAEALYRELKTVMAEDAARRQQATRFGTPVGQESAGEDGGGDSPPPSERFGKAREQAARMVMGRDSHQMLERFGRLTDLAHDETQPAHIRAQAAEEVARIQAGGKVHGAHLRMNAALDLDALDQIAADPETPDLLRAHAAQTATDLRQAEAGMRVQDLARLAAEAVARVNAEKRSTKPKRGPARVAGPALSLVLLPPRAFVALWDDLNGWTRKYDPVEIATALTEPQWRVFEDGVAETVAFADAVRAARTTDTTLLEPASRSTGGDLLVG